VPVPVAATEPDEHKGAPVGVPLDAPVEVAYTAQDRFPVPPKSRTMEHDCTVTLALGVQPLFPMA
jgi:hypothetical protein